MNRKTFKEIYPNDSYFKHVLKKWKFKLKEYTLDMFNATVLCIRLPFLYPRNRWTDRHYNNVKIDKKISKIFDKWVGYSGTHKDEYIKKYGLVCTCLDGKFIREEYIMSLASFKDKFMYNFYKFVREVLSVIHCIPTYTELNAIDKGWRKRFGIQFCKELKHVILESGGKKYMKDFRIMQIKEKWGRLECYVNLYSPEVTRVIEKYGYISQYVCVECGKDAVKKTMGWISPYCDEHVPKNQNWIWIEPVYEWSNLEHKKYNESVLDNC